MLQLIVAEKPSVARDLARVLNVGKRGEAVYQSEHIWITWCLGHMAELCEPEAYTPEWKVWRAQSLPMLPKKFRLRPIAQSRDHWQRLAKWLCHPRVDEIINACDAGREGELIFRFTMELAGSGKPVRRLWLNALTDAAVRRAMQGLKPSGDYDPLAQAARCRAEADWLIGLNATRAMTLRHRPRGGRGALLTVGRVQTPTLGMIVRREEVIEHFEPETYWQVVAQFESAKGSYWGTYAPKPGAPGTRSKQAPAPPQTQTRPQGLKATVEMWPEDRLVNRELAQNVVQAVEHRAGIVSKCVRNEQREVPPLLYDLTALQRRANIRFGMTARATLDAAQALYERHKAITYPRTDSNYLPQDLAASLPQVLKRLTNSDYYTELAPLLGRKPLALGPRIINDAGVTDHHAIIPTGKVQNPSVLSLDEQHVLDLVTRRFIAVFYPPALFAQVRIDTQVAGYGFVSRGRTRLDPGWQAVDPPSAAPKSSADNTPELLPAVEAQDPVQVAAAKLKEGQTKPPPRFSEAMLLSAMERAGRELEDEVLQGAIKDGGLGTPATRAAIIETLKRRDFIRIHGKQLIPTPQGRQLIAAMPVESLKSAQLTGQWEARLSRMARGEYSRATFMKNVEAFARTSVEQILGQKVEGWPEPVEHARASITSTAYVPPAPNQKRTKSVKKTKVAQKAAPKRKGVPASTASRRPQAELAPSTLTLLCPVCQSAVSRIGKVYACAQSRNCTFVIFTSIAQRPIDDRVVASLIEHRRTKKLDGFISREKKPFSAALRLNNEGRVEFDFDSSV
jgi:DNA topoisomerase-3